LRCVRIVLWKIFVRAERKALLFLYTFLGGNFVEEIKFVDYKSCRECAKNIKLYDIKYKKAVLKERLQLKRCAGCDTLIDIADEIRSVEIANKKDTNRETKPSGV